MCSETQWKRNKGCTPPPEYLLDVPRATVRPSSDGPDASDDIDGCGGRAGVSDETNGGSGDEGR